MSVLARPPEWLLPPGDVNDLVARFWPATARKLPGGPLEVGGVSVLDIARDFGTPVYVLDEADFRARAAAFRDAFAGCDVYYAGKAFLCSQVARWIHEAGLGLDVCTGGELAVALRGGIPAGRLAFHGNNKSAAELADALDAGVGRIVVDSFDEIDRLAALAAARGVVADVLVRVTAGVEAHTHQYIATGHEDQKFGFSIAEGAAWEAAYRVASRPAMRLRGLHFHIGSQIFDTAGFELAARRVLTLYAQVRAGIDLQLTELNVGGGFGVAYTTRDDPQSPAGLASAIRQIVSTECGALGIPLPRLSIEPGRAIAAPAVITVYEVGTVKRVALGAQSSRLYVGVDGGMSDNVRAALYDAELSCTLGSRRSDAPATLARVVGKHCESGDVVVKHEFLPADVRPGDLLAVPGTGAYCRAMASNYNLVARPAVVAVRDGKARVVVRRETEADLLRLDVDAD